MANELVPGDLVKFSTGDRIPADIRIIDSVDLEIDESSLTGETEARKKFSTTCPFEGGASIGEPVALAERTCIAYMGTLVRNGNIIFSLDSDRRKLKNFRQGNWYRYRHWNWDGVWRHFFDDARCTFDVFSLSSLVC